MKICSRCKIEKELSEFCKSKKSKDGLYCHCKDCCHELGRIYREKHPDRVVKRHKKYYNEHREEIREYSKIYQENNKEKIREYRKLYLENNKEKEVKRHEKYRDEHREEIRERNREYRRTHKKQRNLFRQQKRKTNIEYKIKCNLRYRIWSAIKINYKHASTEKLTGCSIKELKNYLELKFKDDMTWENYGKWHIDHIKPCDSFDLSKESEQQTCFHYSNLQPLWALDNLKKGIK